MTSSLRKVARRRQRCGGGVRSKDMNVVITDMVMPGGINGRGLGPAAARHQKPRLKVIYTSGYELSARGAPGLRERGGPVSAKAV